MASSAKRHQYLKKVGPLDRISSLSDSTLERVLSFLPTKYAFRTSILSRRWKRLWANIPNLNFAYVNPSCVISFMNFVDRVLLMHDSPNIQRFCLSCNARIDRLRLNSWINVSIKYNVREIHLNVYKYLHYKLPMDLFTCNTLVILKIGSQLRLDVPPAINFPCLKIFHISLLSPISELTEKLFSSCPVLEELDISGYSCQGSTRFTIVSPNLKYLNIVLYSDKADDAESIVVVYAPVLECLNIQSNCLVKYYPPSSFLLVKACVRVEAICTKVLRTGQLVHGLFGLLRGIYSVKRLYLNATTMTALSISSNDETWPKFPWLTHLEVDISHDFDCKSLSHILSGMPNLVIMELSKVPLFDGSGIIKELSWFKPQVVPNCLVLSLKEIRVYGLDGVEGEIELIKYFLNYAEVLEKVVIEYEILDLSKENEFLKKLVTLPRFSKSCNIEFVS